jgi:hypothetical protein
MNKMLLVMFMLIIVMLLGCVTVQYPDGRVETRIDAEMAGVALDTAVTTYNLYLESQTTNPNPSRLTQLLDNIERAKELYDRLMALTGGKKAVINVQQNGIRKVVRDVTVY